MDFEETKAKVRGARVLPTCTYFPTHPKAKLRPSHCTGGGGWGGVEEEFERSMVIKGP